jgi:hypothetical protein
VRENKSPSVIFDFLIKYLGKVERKGGRGGGEGEGGGRAAGMICPSCSKMTMLAAAGLCCAG